MLISKQIMGKKQIPYAEEYQIIYVDTSSLRKYNVDSHPLNEKCTLHPSFSGVQHRKKGREKSHLTVYKSFLYKGSWSTSQWWVVFVVGSCFSDPPPTNLQPHPAVGKRQIDPSGAVPYTAPEQHLSTKQTECWGNHCPQEPKKTGQLMSCGILLGPCTEKGQ